MRLNQGNIDSGPANSKLSDLLDLEDREAVRRELSGIVAEADPLADLDLLHGLMDDVSAIFDGRDPAFEACRTPYHNLEHTFGVIVAAARIGFGALSLRPEFPAGLLLPTMVAALFHDIGLIKDKGDTEGTGAKHMLIHEKRGAAIADGYLARRAVDPGTRRFVAALFEFTRLETPPESIEAGGALRAGGGILGTADLLAQISDRKYLEKLPRLYMEFKEAGMNQFASAYDLLLQTEEFMRTAHDRLDRLMPDRSAAARIYFLHRHGLDRDLYQEAVNKNLEHLGRLVDAGPQGYRAMLRRHADGDEAIN
jgi:hypothetical protein